MKVYKLEYRQLINKNINEVFDFFSNPENLSLITPKQLDFNILTPSPIEMKEGQLIDYTIKIFRKKIRWSTIITKYDAHKMFIDQQLKGPYSMWHHTHIFKDLNGKVEMTDKIIYVMPFGIIGRIVNFMLVQKDLNSIFSFRKDVINKIFEERKI